MKDLKKGYSVAAICTLIAIVLFYNCWSYFSGRCTIAMLLDSSPVAMVLIFCIGLAILVLVALRVVRSASLRGRICRCGMRLNSKVWHYCPECGQPLGRGYSNVIEGVKTFRQ